MRMTLCLVYLHTNTKFFQYINSDTDLFVNSQKCSKNKDVPKFCVYFRDMSSPGESLRIIFVIVTFFQVIILVLVK